MKNNNFQQGLKLIYFLTALSTALINLSCHNQESLAPKNDYVANRVKVYTDNNITSSSNTGSRLSNPVPNGLVVLNSSGNLLLYPFKNNTFYNNGGGTVVGSGYSFQYLTYFPADWNTDGTTDLIILDASGNLWFSRYQNGQFNFSTGTVGHGFSAPVYFVGDWTNDGIPDLVTLSSSNAMTLYPFWVDPQKDLGNFTKTPSTNVGSLNTTYTDYFPADWNNDGTTDLVARDALGNLDFYPFVNNNFTYAGNVGHGFNFVKYFVGDWTEDGIPDLLVEDGMANLIVYPFGGLFSNNRGSGGGTFYGQGGGVVVYRLIVNNYSDYLFADWSNDRMPDLIARDNTGKLFYWHYTLGPQIPPAIGFFNYVGQVGSGWSFNKYFPGKY